MHGHHTYPPTADDQKFLVTTTHTDGIVCHHTAPTLHEAKEFATEHAQDGDETKYYAIHPGRIDGIHWQPVA